MAAVPAELGDLPGRAVGIGLVAAAVATARLLAEARPERVVLVGSAGAFPGSGLAPGQAVVGGRLGLGAAAVTLGLGYQPGAAAPLRAPAVAGVDAPVADVLTNLAITTDPGLVAAFAAEWSVEHMETFGVAWACREAGVPFVPVLGIANRVGPDAHAEWKAWRDRAEAAARVLARRVAGAPWHPVTPATPPGGGPRVGGAEP